MTALSTLRDGRVWNGSRQMKKIDLMAKRVYFRRDLSKDSRNFPPLHDAVIVGNNRHAEGMEQRRADAA